MNPEMTERLVKIQCGDSPKDDLPGLIYNLPQTGSFSDSGRLPSSNALGRFVYIDNYPPKRDAIFEEP